MWATCPVSISLVPLPPCNRTSLLSWWLSSFISMFYHITVLLLFMLLPYPYSLILWSDCFPVIFSSLAIAICSQALGKNSASIKYLHASPEHCILPFCYQDWDTNIWLQWIVPYSTIISYFPMPDPDNEAGCSQEEGPKKGFVMGSRTQGVQEILEKCV